MHFEKRPGVLRSYIRVSCIGRSVGFIATKLAFLGDGVPRGPIVESAPEQHSPERDCCFSSKRVPTGRET